jgi:histidinol-phosphatase (PHP family)
MMLRMADLVSVHGGHSGQFCGHASDSLADVVQAYIDAGFRWVCLTEHLAPHRQELVPEDGAPLDAAALQVRFARYFATARRLQAERTDEIDILVGFETEAFSGYQAWVRSAVRTFAPDMIVGSVHHVHDVPFDCSPAAYRRAVACAGGIEAFYCAYFDRQLELIEALHPAVVGHFDLVRIFDPDYRRRWAVPAIRNRALRNLRRIAELGLILDFNLRPLAKGDDEPYVSPPWLKAAVALGIDLAPGDDSHGVATCGVHVPRGIELLAAAGASTRWRRRGATREAAL